MEDLYLVGTFNAWDVRKRYQFDRIDDYIYTLLAELPAGKIEFKIGTVTEAAANNFGSDGDEATVTLNQLTYLKDGGDHLSINLTYPGIYFFFLDFSQDQAQPSLRVVPKHEVTTPEELRDQPGFGLDHFLDMQLPVTFELGKTKLSINEALSLGKGSILELDKLAGESINVYVGGKLVALGELVVVNDNFGVQVLTVLPSTLSTLSVTEA
ncbi:FliM/FliN family flagellar motor switch protein [Deltaproteobacteria bacterium TL4]